ncbi:MAG TPA: CaiB/BaiF CoA-transferase family protein [Usitatibacter sp.]|nr:CaiB/BaiF CoA-transferase family protein [Usitatibacter sp.]
MTPLAGLKVVTTALNLPGPAACARLHELGAAVTKIEPPSGDPFEAFCAPWYRRLHEGIAVSRLDLKAESGRASLRELLGEADLLVTAQRPSALARLGLDPESLASRHPRLCHVAITGHPSPHEETPGHDLTYLAMHGLLTPPAMPVTLFADMAGAERAVATALALVIGRQRTGRGAAMHAPLEDAARMLAQPLHEGLTRRDALLGGGYAGYNLYGTLDGWIAVAALEPHFAERLAQALGLEVLTVEALRACFASQSAAHWQRWALERDLPIVALRGPSNEIPS